MHIQTFNLNWTLTEYNSHLDLDLNLDPDFDQESDPDPDPGLPCAFRP